MPKQKRTRNNRQKNSEPEVDQAASKLQDLNVEDEEDVAVVEDSTDNKNAPLPVQPQAALAVEQPTHEPSTRPKTEEQSIAVKPQQALTKRKYEKAEDINVVHEKGNMSTHELMKRPGFGSKGTPIQLFANFYRVTLNNMKVHHYDVAVWRKNTKKGGDGEVWIEVSRLPRFLAVLLMNELFNKNKPMFHNRYGLAFDGQKNLLASYELAGVAKDNPKEFLVKVKNPEKQIDEEFKIRLQFASEIAVDLKRVFSPDLRDRDSIATMIYDIVLKQRYFFNEKDFIPAGRRIFYYPERLNMFPLGDGVYRYPGFWQSLRPVEGWNVMINLDQANTSFIVAKTVLELLADLGVRPPAYQIPERDMRMVGKKLEKLVKGLKITQTQRFIQRTAKCTGVSIMSATNMTFPLETNDGKMLQCTVAKYFQQMYAKKEFAKPLKFPHLPCLKLGNKSWIPAEFCEIKGGQRYCKKLDGNQTSKMLKVASQPADERQRLIQADMDYLKLDEDPHLKAFGINVSNKMTQLTGRVLPAPQIQYKTSIVKPINGGWNMRENRVIQGCEIRNFAVLITANRCDANTVRAFVQEWYNSAVSMGMIVRTKTPAIVQQESQPERVLNQIRSFKQTIPQLDLVFVILESQNTDFYAHAKQAGDVVEGVNTQCIQLKNVCMPKPATMANLNLKINGKLGGVNCELTAQDMKNIKDFLKDEIMYMGADVNHDAPEDCREEPVSCAAIVASVDNKPSVYCARIFLQHQEKNGENGSSTRRPQEWIGEMEYGVHMALEMYVKRRGVLPRRIIMYRDGVGETMFGLVLNKELLSMRKACDAFASRNPQFVVKSGFKNGRYEPSITFIVVQKRHHTRLFCVNAKDAMVRNGFNVPPGTVVDRTITHPVEFDVYLCSHLGLQGTSKPAHYHVLWDENKFSADELHLLTYYLCYTYCRSTRSVSIPPPCYYSDLVAYRARQYLKAIFGGSDTASQISGASGRNMNLQEMQKIVNVHLNIVQKGMYFV